MKWSRHNEHNSRREIAEGVFECKADCDTCCTQQGNQRCRVNAQSVDRCNDDDQSEQGIGYGGGEINQGLLQPAPL